MHGFRREKDFRVARYVFILQITFRIGISGRTEMTKIAQRSFIKIRLWVQLYEARVKGCDGDLQLFLSVCTRVCIPRGGHFKLFFHIDNVQTSSIAVHFEQYFY